jgi:hypothetical protein
MVPIGARPPIMGVLKLPLGFLSQKWETLSDLTLNPRNFREP